MAPKPPSKKHSPSSSSSSCPPPPPGPARAQRGSSNTRLPASGVPGTSWQVPFLYKKKNKGSRTETATTLPLSGQPPRSSAKVTRRGKLDPQRPSPSWAPGRGGSEGEAGGKVQVNPSVLTWAQGAPLPPALLCSDGEGRPELPQLWRERLRRETPIRRHSPARGTRRERVGRTNSAAGQRGAGGRESWRALSGVRVPFPRPPPTFDPGAQAAAPPFSLRGPALPPSAARAPTPFPSLAHPSGPAQLARTHTPRTQCPSPPSCRQPLLGSAEGGRRRRRRRRFSILARRASGPACPQPALGRRKGAGAGRGAAFGALSLSHSRSARLPPPRRGAPGTGGGEAGGWSVFAARPHRPPSWLRAVPAASRPGAPRGPGGRGPRPGLSSPPRTAIPCPPAKLPEASPPFSNLPCPVSA